MMKLLLQFLVAFGVLAGSAKAYNKHYSNNYAGIDTIIYNGSKSICPGGSIQLSIPAQPPNAAINWLLNNVVITNTNSPVFTATQPGDYSVSVKTDTSSTVYPMVHIISGTTPVSKFSYTIKDPCPSSPVVFRSESSGGNLKYLWTFGDPNSNTNDSSTLKNPSHFFIGNRGNSDQVFQVSLAVTNEAGCIALSTNSVTLKQSPSTALDGTGAITFSGKPYFASCTGVETEFTFTNKSRTDNTGYVIQWGDGSVDFRAKTFSTTTHKFKPGLYKLFFSVSGANGCSYTQTYNVFVGVMPSVPSLAVISNTICKNEPVKINVNGLSGNSPGTIYRVTYSDGTSLNYAAPFDTLVHVFKTSSFGNTAATSAGPVNNAFTATITAANPCGNAVADIGPVYVSDNPPVQIKVNGNGAASPINTVTNVSLQGAFGNSISADATFKNKVVWKVNPSDGYLPIIGAGSDGDVNPNKWVTGSASLGITFAKAGMYTIILKKGNGSCGADSVTKIVCVDPSPVASFSASNATICQGSAVDFKDSSVGSLCGITSYLWTVTYTPLSNCSSKSEYNFTNGTNATSINPQILFNGAGNYVVTLKITNPAQISSYFSQNIQVVERLQTSIVVKNVVFTGESVKPVLANTACAVANGNTYQWTFTGATPSTYTGEIPPPVTYAMPGNFMIAVDILTPCGLINYTRAILVFPKPIIDTATNNALLHIPNTFTPNGDGINDTWKIKGTENYNQIEVDVFNRYGNIVYKANNYDNEWPGTTNGQKLPAGVYYYVIKTERSRSSGYVTILY
ncbi:T9SS type B sorting domain-containing protein [Mucilaginibacter agri]|uniref:T9SS type B sorting domain-containing protein n=1 Tax=Mucilaginibacter agri TaxID=2695265 RepID=A0A965ZMN3_9SPHI|nr:gliding motility-associated C-terminal domain-containing protein [Mucilaginibacter agri]NCD72392.1 T9SS type B sorting domain-containing protein [Mucilaginibacter agri]